MKKRDVLLLTGLVVALVPSLAAQTDAPPLSATDTSYLSCTTWNGHGWTKSTARSARTHFMVSQRGFRAYGEVEGKVAPEEGCENTTTLRVASGIEQAYKVAYVQSARNGNGIRLMGWSPSGNKLLAQVNLWSYESDSGYDHVAVVYDAATNSAKEITELDKELSRHFGPNCELELAVIGWKTDDQILVKVSRPAEDPSYEQRFCVKQPRIFGFDLSRNALVEIKSKSTAK